ncbi:hypothetical protein CDD81_7329 [Ophiocordyceps australis]|uniref:Enoyl-CoA hydratase n=1 Tax=Ophiocordyceps australis TaxID=1399860 RepID=A0A2C5Y4P2_9HYPO|nr:hypothetical protein CDD81_7329 [Ophiocordyceps australis]
MSSPQPLTGYNYEFFNVEQAGEWVAHLEINRPRKLNAFSQPVWQEFGRVFEQLSKDSRVRVVVLSGAGERAFTSGLDVQAAAQSGPLTSNGEGLDAARKAKSTRAHIEEFQSCVSAMERCEKPVICVLHGVSIGLAIDIACCADVRLCSSDTRFAVKEVDIGLAADIGTLARLPKVVGTMGWVKEVCMTARDFGASEAASVGFVSRVHGTKAEALAAGIKLAEVLASKSPVAVQSTKELLNYGRDHGVADSLRYTAVWNSVALQASDVPMALMSSMQRSKPTFEKL